MRSSVRSKPCKLRLGSHGEGDLRDPKTVSCCRGREERTRVHGHDRRLSRPALSLPPRLELFLVPSSSSSLLPLLLHWDLGGPTPIPYLPDCARLRYPDKQTLLLETTVAVEAVASPATCQKGVRDDALRTQV